MILISKPCLNLLLLPPFQLLHKHVYSIDSSSLLSEFTTYCYQRDLPRAMNTLSTMHTHNIYADSVTYSELIKCCISRGAIREGKLVHNHVFSHGYRPMTFLINVFLNMYVKFNLIDDAREVFDNMAEKNVVSWTTMIAAFTNVKDYEKAIEFLILMLRDGIRPNSYTFSSVLRACSKLSELRQIHCSIVKYGLESDVFVRSALVDIYSKWGDLVNAERVFSEMPTGDLVVWNSIIGAFAQNNEGDEALNLFKKMKRCGFAADRSLI